MDNIPLQKEDDDSFFEENEKQSSTYSEICEVFRNLG